MELEQGEDRDEVTHLGSSHTALQWAWPSWCRRFSGSAPSVYRPRRVEVCGGGWVGGCVGGCVREGGKVRDTRAPI